MVALALALGLGYDLYILDGKYTQAAKNVIYLTLHRL